MQHVAETLPGSKVFSATPLHITPVKHVYAGIEASKHELIFDYSIGQFINNFPDVMKEVTGYHLPYFLGTREELSDLCDIAMTHAMHVTGKCEPRDVDHLMAHETSATYKTLRESGYPVLLAAQPSELFERCWQNSQKQYCTMTDIDDELTVIGEAATMHHGKQTEK